MDQLNKSAPSVPPVQPPRSEGVSRRAILIIVLLVLIFYVANWISTKPLTRRPNLATPTFMATHRALGGVSNMAVCLNVFLPILRFVIFLHS
jgi:hypothetical protein